MTGSAPKPVEPRLLANVVVDDDGCWLRYGYVAPNGYTKISINGVEVSAHVVAYRLFVGEVPAGHDVGHRCHDEDERCPGGACKHRRCINPAHLVAQTRSDNLRAGRGNGLKDRTRCAHGHEFTPENTIRRKGNFRRCRACKNAEQRDRRARSKQ